MPARLVFAISKYGREPFIFGVKLLINKNPITQILLTRRASTHP